MLLVILYTVADGKIININHKKTPKHNTIKIHISLYFEYDTFKFVS